MAKLILKLQQTVINEYQLDIDKDTIGIGRSRENDILIDSRSISAFHAKITREEGQYFIEDLNSLNGTYVRGKKVHIDALYDGDEIKVGKHTLIFVVEQLAKGKTTAPQPVPKPPQKTPPHPKPPVIDDSLMREHGGFLVLQGDLEKREYPIVNRVTVIGKDKSAEIRLKGMFIPQTVAVVHKIQAGIFITPNNEKSLLTINNEPVTERYQLKNGDIIQIKNYSLQFYFE
jgi:pSer/pThr/pTyr-binding forkhead associated (FHA) protein